MKNICLTASSALLLMSATALAQQEMEEHPMTAEPAEECLNELDQLEQEAEQAQLSHSTQEEVRQLTETARMLGERGRDEACNTMVDTINTITEEEQMRMGQQRSQQATASQAQRVTEYQNIVRASKINGATVRNTQNEELGTIEDAVIDPRSGEISYVVLSVGGFLGVGEKFVGIPWDELSIVEDRQSGETHYVVEANRQDLQNRQGLDKENWPRSVESRWDSAKSQQGKTRKGQ